MVSAPPSAAHQRRRGERRHGASLVKVGDGTLILSGTNTYTGLTAVLGGMLQLGDGGTSGSILGNVITDATFAINRSDTYTFGGLIEGDGSFVQMGPGHHDSHRQQRLSRRHHDLCRYLAVG